MPRSSRHRSHRGHRHERERSGSASSEEDAVEEKVGSRRRRDGSPPPPEASESSKRRKASSPAGRSGLEGANGADPAGDQGGGGRKRKDRDSRPPQGDVDAASASAAPASASDRWTGDAGSDVRVEDKRVKAGEPVSPDVDKAAKGKADSRSRTGSGRRHSGADGGGKDEGGGSTTRDDSSRRRAEKESARRETTDRDRDKDRATDKDYGHGSSRNGERSSEKERGHHAPARDKEVEPELLRDDKSKRSKERSSNADVEVHPDRDTGRKKQDDPHSSDTERKLKKQIVRDNSSDKGKLKGEGRDGEDRVNDLDRNGVHRNAEKHRRYRDSREDSDRDRRSRDDRHRMASDRPSRDHSNERSEIRYQKDMSRRQENHRRQDKNREGSPSTRGHNMKYEEGRARKGPSDEKQEPITKSHGEIEPRAVVERSMLDSDYNKEDRGRPESVHSNRVDSNSRHKETMRSPSSAVHILQDEYRALSKDRNHTSSASSGDHASISGAAEKALDSYSVESNTKHKGTAHSADYTIEDGLPPRSDSHLSSILTPEKSPRSDRYNADRKGNISSGSPSNMPTPIRHGSGSSSVQGSGEYDGRAQSGDYRNVSRYKRNGDPKMGRGQGNTWNGVPSWSPPVPNGFMPFPHGPPGPFHQIGQQYPVPSLFGVRPLDFNHAAGVPFHMHEFPDRFPGRPFGWRNPSGESGPQFQGWEGSAGVFGNDSHMFGRGEWEHGRRMNNHGWDTSSMKGKDEKIAMDLDSNKRPDISVQLQTNEIPTEEFKNQSRGQLSEHVDTRQKANAVVEERDAQTDLKIKAEPVLKPCNDKGTDFLGLLLSKLDVSANLTSPELYSRISINRNGDNKTNYSRVFKQINGQDGEKLNLGIRSLSHGTRAFLPAVADDVFKKAFSLYKIGGKMGNDVKLSQKALIENDNSLETCSGENKTSTAIPSAVKDNTSDADATQSPENCLAPMALDNTDIREQKLAANPAELVEDGNNEVNNVSSISHQLSSSCLSRQTGSDLVENCAKECVALIPEFVTRIHSPGSSH